MRNSNENSRVTLSFGLIAFYLAIVNLLSLPNVDSSYWAKLIKNTLLFVWGIPTVFLILFIFFYALDLKYKSSGKIDLMGYEIPVSVKFKRVFFDLGVEYYIKGLFTYFLYNIPFYLIEKNLNPLLSWIIFIAIVAVVSFLLLIIEKKSTK